MSKVRVLVGTRKGAFILTSDGTRRRWKVSGPHFAGWEIYHMKGSVVDPDRIYASQTSAWFGQIIQRSDDGGKTWNTPGSSPEELQGSDGTPKAESNKFVYDTSSETGKPITTHQWYDGTQHPWEFKRVWHLEPSLHDPDHVYAGVEDAAIFESKNGGKSWHELAGLRGHPDFAFHPLELRSDPLVAVVAGVEAVFHLAAMPGLTRSWTDFDLYESCNVTATQRLLEAVRSSRSLQRFIYGLARPDRGTSSHWLRRHKRRYAHRRGPCGRGTAPDRAASPLCPRLRAS